MKLKRFKINIIFVLISCSIFAQENSELQSQLERVTSSKEFENANLTIAIVDVESGDLVAGERPKKVLVPASSLKLLTTFTALEVLTKDFKFTTKISYDGHIEFDGTLQGNLYIEGSGDPTLGSTKFPDHPSFNKMLKKIADAVKEEGIACVEGEIIADESIINTQPVSPSWQWNDLGNYYASGAWGINVNENLYAIEFSNRGTVGRRPKIAATYPKIPNLRLSNEIVVDSAGSGDNAYIFGGPYNYYKRIIGTIPAGSGNFTIKGAIPDPPYFMAFHIERELEKNKIKTGGIKTVFIPGKNVADRKTILKFVSPSLESIIRLANFESNNLYVEALNKMTGLEKNGLASGQNGIAAIRSLLRKLKVDYSGMHLEDGSGLSARNNISAFTLAKFLSEFSRKKGIDYVIKFIPRCGYSGTVKSMFSGTNAKGNVWAKSGSMSRIQSFTGFVKAKSGKWLSFSIIANGYDVNGSVIRKKMEKIMREIYDHG